MVRKFAHITRSEFESFLSSFVANWNRSRPEGTKEWVYDLPLPSEKHSIRVFSSIVGDDSRGCGDDAIRVTMWDHEEDTWVGGRKKTLRIGPTDSNPDGWKGNLRPKIEDMYATWRDHLKSCPKCGAPMKFRSKWDFWGCSRYPDCEGTVNP